MRLDLDDTLVITGIVIAARAGAFLLTNRTNKRNLVWSQSMIGRLFDFAQWNHQAVRKIAEVHNLDVGVAPCIQKHTPPPVESSWNELAEEITDHGGGKGKK